MAVNIGRSAPGLSTKKDFPAREQVLRSKDNPIYSYSTSVGSVASISKPGPDSTATVSGLSKNEAEIRRSTPLPKPVRPHQPSGKYARKMEKQRRIRFLVYTVMVLVLMLILILSGIGFKAADWVVSKSSLTGKLQDGENASARPANNIKIDEISERSVINRNMGNVRIVEGTAINQAVYSLTRIKVLGELRNSSGLRLKARVAYCGNILEDDQLAEFQEEDINTALSRFQESRSLESTLAPGGRARFMIVFPGVSADETVIVKPVSADRVPI